MHENMRKIKGKIPQNPKPPQTVLCLCPWVVCTLYCIFVYRCSKSMHLCLTHIYKTFLGCFLVHENFIMLPFEPLQPTMLKWSPVAISLHLIRYSVVYDARWLHNEISVYCFRCQRYRQSGCLCGPTFHDEWWNATVPSAQLVGHPRTNVTLAFG